jgi:amidase
MHDFWTLDATAQAGLVRRTEVSPRELVEAAIARIESVNPHINAVITRLYDRALSRAGAAPGDAPFAGVPMLLKDACAQFQGTRYCLGTKVLRDLDYRSPHTTELVRRFQRAGFVFLGKTNVPEMSGGVTTEPDAFGPTRNPWDLTRTSGGSSGGSAAAVASGMVAVAHGSDAGGSLRYPAACCGVVTLKPSRGRVPSTTPTGVADTQRWWAEFVLARSVRDIAGVLDAVHGPDERTSSAAPQPSRPYADDLRAPAQPLRIGMLLEDVMAHIPTDAACVDAVRRAGALLADAGHHVEESHPAALDDLFVRTAGAMAVITGTARHPGYRWLCERAGRELTEDDIKPEYIVTEEDAAKYSAPQLLDALDALERAIAPLHDWWETYDILITPALRQPAWPLGQTGGAADAGVFPPPFTFSGQPAVVVPVTWTDAGLPVAIQLVAAYGREDLLLQVASQLEEAAPWRERWPAIATN